MGDITYLATYVPTYLCGEYDTITDAAFINHIINLTVQ